MIVSALTKIENSGEAILAPGAVVLAEGQAMVRSSGSQSAGVLPSAGASGEVFAGFAFAGLSAAPMPEAYTNKVETLTAPAGGSITLQFTPVSGQLYVWDNTAGAVVASPTITAATISGLTSAHSYTVTYKYALTVLQARALYGDVQPGGYAGATVGQIGLIKRGTVYTSEFDASVNWATVTSIKLAANGQLTSQAGSGVVINGAVVGVPSADYPYLGIEFSAI
jgi:hypothetical protein